MLSVQSVPNHIDLIPLSLHDALPIWPVIRKRQIRHVIVPDGIVQAERSVASAPAVARSLQGVDDQRRHAKLLQSCGEGEAALDRKSTRLNSSHLGISYAVFCLKKKNT